MTEDASGRFRGLLTRHRGLLRWLIACGLGALAVRTVLADPTPLRALASVEPKTVLWLWALALLNMVFISQRMSLSVVECGGPKVPAWTWFKLVVVGQFVNLVVPQLGNVYRGVQLKREHGVSYLAYASGLVAFVWLDTILGVLFCSTVLAVLRPGLRLGGMLALPILGGLFVALVAGPLLVARVLERTTVRAGLASRLHELARRLVVTATRSLSRPAFLLRFFVIGLLVTAVHVAALLLCFEAVGAPIDLPTAALFQVLVKVSNQIVVTPGNLGLTELAWGVLGSAATGAGVGGGVTAALLHRAAFTPLLLLLGLAFGGLGVIARTRATRDSNGDDAGAKSAP